MRKFEVNRGKKLRIGGKRVGENKGKSWQGLGTTAHRDRISDRINFYSSKV